jgi:hypothetical protein
MILDNPEALPTPPLRMRCFGYLGVHMAKGKRRRQRGPRKQKLAPRLTTKIMEDCLRDAAKTVKEVERQLEASFALPPGAVSLRIL